MILDRIVAQKRLEHGARTPVDLDSLVQTPRAIRPLAVRLRQPGTLGVIAEFKRRSPSAGVIAKPGVSAADVARGYAQAGAAGLSLLTDQDFFGAELGDLKAARAAVELPVLRKDFLLDERDVVESWQLGADVVLLIVRLLSDSDLTAMHRRAVALGLEALVEVHDEVEAERALAAGARMIGVNHRDLDTLAIDLSLSARVAGKLPSDVVKVGESGLKTAADLSRMRQHGMDAVLIGEQLMRAADPGAALATLLAEFAAC